MASSVQPNQGAVTSDGYGDCPAFQHSHGTAGQCFDDDDNPVTPPDERARLDNEGNKIPTEKDTEGTLQAISAIERKFVAIYKSAEYPYARLEWEKIATVQADLDACEAEPDPVKLKADAEQLTVDYGLLDSYDDMLRRSSIT